MEMGSVKVERTRTRLVDLLRDALITTERDAKSAGVTVHLSEPPQPCVVQVDKDLMPIAVNNLLTNAVKYNRAEGEVYMTLAEDDACITISVRDTGIGIAAEDQERIFDKFYRVDSDAVTARSGHGLGLALAKEIVLAHLGELEIESTLGEGTEFRIVLKKTPILVQSLR